MAHSSWDTLYMAQMREARNVSRIFVETSFGGLGAGIVTAYGLDKGGIGIRVPVGQEFPPRRPDRL
jgi:hypothetical protein